jgi:hypothetical protein
MTNIIKVLFGYTYDMLYECCLMVVRAILRY